MLKNEQSNEQNNNNYFDNNTYRKLSWSIATVFQWYVIKNKKYNENIFR